MRDHSAESNGTEAGAGLQAEVEELRRRLAALEASAPRQVAGQTTARKRRVRPTAKGAALLVAGVVLASATVVFGQGAVEALVVSKEGNVEVAGRVKVKAIEFPDGGIQTGALPAHAVMAFNLTTCPAGWKEFEPAMGRFVRGIDPTGKIDPDGKRPPGSTQEDAIRDITGTLYGVKGQSDNALPWGFRPTGKDNGAFYVAKGTEKGYNRYNYAYFPEDGIGTSADFKASRVVPTAAENRPKNVSLLYCEKQ